jgi:hypothetical protein
MIEIKIKIMQKPKKKSYQYKQEIGKDIKIKIEKKKY